MRKYPVGTILETKVSKIGPQCTVILSGLCKSFKTFNKSLMLCKHDSFSDSALILKNWNNFHAFGKMHPHSFNAKSNSWSMNEIVVCEQKYFRAAFCLLISYICSLN